MLRNRLLFSAVLLSSLFKHRRYLDYGCKMRILSPRVIMYIVLLYGETVSSDIAGTLSIHVVPVSVLSPLVTLTRTVIPVKV